jgi:hypothetical protein
LIILLVLALAFAWLAIDRKSAPAPVSAVQITWYRPPHMLFTGPPVLTIRNNGSGALLVWEPCRTERKETGRIVVGGIQTKVRPLSGASSSSGPGMLIMPIELKGTNHGPWRVLLPVTRYELLARVEKLLGLRLGTFAITSPLFASLLGGSRTWVKSDWFDEPSHDILSPYTNPHARLPGPHGDFADRFRNNFRPDFPDQRREVEESQMFFFIARNFRARFNRWPTNFAETKSFAADRANLQPEFPAAFENPEVQNVLFTTNADGGLTVSFKVGSSSRSMSIGGPR